MQARWVVCPGRRAPGPHPRAARGRRFIFPRGMAARPAAGRTRGFVHFFARSARLPVSNAGAIAAQPGGPGHGGLSESGFTVGHIDLAYHPLSGRPGGGLGCPTGVTRHESVPRPGLGFRQLDLTPARGPWLRGRSLEVRPHELSQPELARHDPSQVRTQSVHSGLFSLTWSAWAEPGPAAAAPGRNCRRPGAGTLSLGWAAKALEVSVL